jgi:hypothetical protein
MTYSVRCCLDATLSVGDTSPGAPTDNTTEP